MYKEIYIILISKLINILTRRFTKIYKVNGLAIHKFKGVFPPKNMLSNDALLVIVLVMRKLIIRRGFRFNFLEIGVGSGVISLSLDNVFTYVIGIDINFQACLNTLYNDHERRLDIICGDSSSSIRSNSIDIIYVNPPYLPCSARDVTESSICAGRDKLDVYKLVIHPIRVMRRKGIFIISLSNISTLLSIIINYISKLFSRVKIYSWRFMPFERINVYLLIRNR